MKRFLVLLLALVLFVASAFADSVFILCQPDSWVNIRSAPNRKGAIIGRYELGQEVQTDGRKQGGFVHLVDLPLEDSEGWVSAGFVTGSPVTVRRITGQIMSTGRVACRRAVNGSRRKWLKDGQEVVIFAWSDAWAVTDNGFIKTQYLGGF